MCVFLSTRNCCIQLGAGGEEIDEVSDPISQCDSSELTGVGNADVIKNLRGKKGRRFTTSWGPEGFNRAQHPLSIMVTKKWSHIPILALPFRPPSSLTLYSLRLLSFLSSHCRWIQPKLTSWSIRWLSVFFFTSGGHMVALCIGETFSTMLCSSYFSQPLPSRSQILSLRLVSRCLGMWVIHYATYAWVYGCAYVT